MDSRKRFSVRSIGAIATLLCVLVAPIYVAAQQSASGSPGGALDIKVIGDKILARVELQTEVWFKDTHVIVDYDMPYAMMIQSCVFGNVRFGEGETNMRILNENFRVEVPRAEIVPEQGTVCGELTGKYDKHLDQIDIVAIIGWPLLREFGMTLDIQEETLALHPEGELVAADVRAESESFVEGVEVIGGSVFVPVNYNGGQQAFMKMSTKGYHTVLNREIIDDRNAGVVDEAYFGFDDTTKISDMAALYPQDLYTNWWNDYAAAKEEEKQIRAALEEQGRTFPEEYAVTTPDQPSSDVLLVSGMSILSGYRIVLDPSQGFIGVTRTTNSNYSDADFQFYMAAAAEDQEALYTYIEENQTDRNVEEAVSEFFSLGLENETSQDRLVSAIDYGLAVNEERRKFMYVANFVFDVYSDVESRDQFTDLIITLGEKALEFTPRSDQPRFKQQVRSIVGDRYLARNEAREAYSHFLAAAFQGDPELDSISHFDRGRALEAMGQEARAYANYDKALNLGGLPQSQSESATEALERLRPKIDSDSDLFESDTQGG
ncbi:MAG: hypothetical protein F4X44_00705 [Gammaproteobacteria bacterium]|nr:hypothetical protein [Gammaproteobacteria bacterium]MYD79123.1 hypothetical protein [Gammaproteobacteria bacterium]